MCLIAESEVFAEGWVLLDSIKIFSSSNGVLLTEGINGAVPPKYFKRVVHKLPKGEIEELVV